MPLLMATSFSRPVETSGGSVTSNGTAWRCMLEPIERPVGVVMLQERDQAGRDADHLLGDNIDVLHLVGVDVAEVAAEAGDDLSGRDLVPIRIGVSAGAR